MTFLHELVKEMAAAGATGAGAVAAAPGGLFKGGVIQRKKKKKKITDSYRLDPTTISVPRGRSSWRVIGEMVDSSLKGQGEESTFDPADVISKLKHAEKQVDNEDDTVPFGLEDEDGKVVKVYVRAEQADEFESALAIMLAGDEDDDDDDETISNVEIAEVLFRLKDKFDIVDVEWPEIEGDEEEEQEVQGGAEGEMGAEGGGGEMPGAEGEMGAEGGDMEGMEDLEGEGMEDEMEPEGGAESALQQVIDMMKADAEARKAESEARAKEAEARTAEAHAQSAASKVSQEEQILDAEAHEKQKKSEKDETERLAKIARMKHDQASGAETALAQAEDEEEVAKLERIRDINRNRPEAPISVRSLADELIKRLRGNIR